VAIATSFNNTSSTGGNLTTVDTGGKFFIGVGDTGGKFVAGFVDTSGAP
jgi:hypothetical protein